MKVNGQTNKSLQGVGGNNLKKLEGKGTEENNPLKDLGQKNDSAKIDLSDRARDIKRIKELAMAAPDVNEQKVERLRNLIDSGSYKVDSHAIADKLVNEHVMNAALDKEE